MKKLLLAGTTLAAAFATTPASAQLELGLAGHFRGYAVYSKDDVPGFDLREFDLRRDAEIHFTGETALDNGLTVGVHHEIIVGDDIFNNSTDESYAYFSGNWGRVNFGSEDGAAYLLQVAAPSADSNIDGLRPYIQAFVIPTPFGYDHADFKNAERITYLTPKFNGFQAGFSYAPDQDQRWIGSNLAPMPTDNDVGDYEHLWEVAARWDGEFKGFGLSLGAGYSDNKLEEEGTIAGEINDGIKSWNLGANVTAGEFSLGGGYRFSESSFSDGAGGSDDVEGVRWLVGAGWDRGPYHLGVSYFKLENELAGVEIVDIDRFTVGGGYAFGPGMSFRGAVALGEVEMFGAGADLLQVTLGTDIQF